MSVLSDVEISELCIKPDYYLFAQDRVIPVIVNLTHPKEQVERMLLNPNVRITKADEESLTKFGWKPMVSPFLKESINTLETVKGSQKILSKGLSSAGYDITLSEKDLKVFTNLHSAIVDPRKVDERCYTRPEVRIDDNGLTYVLQPPNSVMLGHTEEWFNIPRDILGTCVGKSTYARVGVSLIVTPLEPGWSGELVVEIVNNTNSPVKIYPGQGIGQINFLRLGKPCLVSYSDRGGKYQDQTSTQDAKV